MKMIINDNEDEEDDSFALVMTTLSLFYGVQLVPNVRIHGRIRKGRRKRWK